MEINDEYIIKEFLTKNGKINIYRLKRCSEEELIYLKNRYYDSENIKETIWRIYRHIENRPVCKICGGYVKFIGTSRQEYSYTCCKEHAIILNSKHGKETCLKKYGVNNAAKTENSKKKNKKKYYSKTQDELNQIIEKRRQTNQQLYNVDNCFQSKEVVKKIKQVKFERYGNENFVNVEKAKQTKFEKYGDENYINVEKIKQVKFERYGDENYNNMNKTRQTKFERYGDENFVNVEKAKQTKIERYGDEFFYNEEKIKQTNNERYGVDYYTQTDEFKEKLIETKIRKYGGIHYYNEEKAKQTNNEKYGVDYYTQTDEFKKHLSEVMSKPETIKKRIETAKKNKTIGNQISKEEQIACDIIKEKYKDIKQQYISDVYPFTCDFYIPSIDTYIEYQGSWTHGKKPYEGTEQDNIILEQWKEKAKNSEYYKIAINVWTKKDIEKRKIALLNHLNYIELWTLDDVYKFIKN